MATIDGTSGPDSLTGTNGDDWIYSLSGDDTIFGLNGHDFLKGGLGEDVIYGGGGNDYLNGEADNDTLYGGDGNDTVDGSYGSDVIYGGDGDDWLIAEYIYSSFKIMTNNTVYGEDGDDTLTTSSYGTDILDGGAGHDFLLVQNNTTRDEPIVIDLAASSISGGVFDGDSIISIESVSIEYNFKSSATITGSSVANTINTSNGNDTISGGGGNDVISADDGDDSISGGSGDDDIDGGSGKDIISGGSGDDDIRIDAYDSSVSGNSGDDRFEIGSYFSLGAFTSELSVSGGADEDTLHFIDTTADIIVNFDTSKANVKGANGEYDFAFSSIEEFTGGKSITYVGGPTKPLTVFTHKQISDQLTDGYWQSVAQDRQSFDVSSDHIITVNISGLNSDGARFAKAAFSLWAGVSGLDFQYVTGSADITLDDEKVGGGTNNTVSGKYITSSDVNVGKQMLLDEGPNVESYAFSTYIHEIGHALGLGHAGNYNSSAKYKQDGSGDNHYLNDSEQLTIMSYFNQTVNTFSNASAAADISPMIVDILAIQDLYSGLTVSNNAGNTTYDLEGAGTVLDRADMDWGGTPIAMTLHDTGGKDTFDASKTTENQKANMNDGRIWDINGGKGNVIIAWDTLIENFKGGAGVDRITGNEMNNKIIGNGGNDILKGGAGADILIGNTGRDILKGGGGKDKLNGGKGIDILKGGGQKDILIGGGNNDVLWGQAGNDVLRGGTGRDILKGHGGNDKLSGGGGKDFLVGGAGADKFQFRGNKNEGRDIIKDFNNGVDLIQIKGGIKFTDIDISDNGTNTFIKLDSGTVIVLRNVLESAIDAGDFLL